MRKIHILKAIVDFIWIVSMPVIPLILIFIPMLFVYDDLSDLNLRINGIELAATDNFMKILTSISILTYLLLIYCIYIFKKTLRYFLANRIFSNQVIKGFSTIGNLLLISGIILMIASIVSKLHLRPTITIELGLNTNIIIICFGLFFLILSETFRLSMTLEQENDLTI